MLYYVVIFCFRYTTNVSCKWSGHNPSASGKGPRVQMCRPRIDLLQAVDFIWMPYSSPDVLQVVNPEVLEPRHTALWWCVTALIYFTVIEWHQIDRVLPQFGGVQPWSQPALNIDFLMSKDGRDPGPSHDFLDWWVQHGKRFFSPEMYLRDPRAVPIPVEATQRGVGRVPEMDRVDDVPDMRRFERRARVGTGLHRNAFLGVIRITLIRITLCV
ncbi:serine/threonine-protein phosphatase 7 long form homolog [Arachis stenosperma]|uniref:serine/threonine-protein phosphatase 7 long form homolog n=1 Tax=Arachis stenosperma TaxID=217475 RepID=UPI0025AD8421|nr:serine/threonine-protein phosphatase 7 long form homolog [Arachis stenosperma]